MALITSGCDIAPPLRSELEPAVPAVAEQVEEEPAVPELSVAASGVSGGDGKKPDGDEVAGGGSVWWAGAAAVAAVVGVAAVAVGRR